MTSPSPDENDAAPIDHEHIYQPAAGELQLTVRAVAIGCVIGALLAAMNIYLGLRIGITEGGSLIAAILSFALFTVLAPKRPFTVLETNIAQTAGSGAGAMPSAAGMLAPIPAMAMLDHPVPLYALFIWALSVAYLGVFFAVPLRRQYVVAEKLRFPSGLATASTIVAMFAKAGEAVAQARALLWCGAIAGGYVLIAFFVPQMEDVPFHSWLGVGALTTAATWGFYVYVGPMMLGAGILVGTRVAVSAVIGSIIAWAIVGPIAKSHGWAPGAVMSYADGPRGWILWCGVAIMVSESLMALVMAWKTFVNAFKRPVAGAEPSGNVAEDPASAIPNRWWILGLAGASVVTIVLAWHVFGIAPHLTVVAIAMSSILAMVAVRSTGETDWNPIGGMGKVTQLVFGALSPGTVTTNLMAAGITGAGASQAGDMMQDLKTGYLLGASPRKQFIAQLVGIGAGVIACVPIYYLFDAAFDIGASGSTLEAPAAHAWKAMAELLSEGLDAMPKNAAWAALIGMIFGGSLPIIRKLFPKIAPYTPSGLAIGLAFLIQPKYFVTMFVGAMLFVGWKRSRPDQAERFMYPVACGLVAGEGLMGVVKAGLMVAGIGGGH